MSFQICIFLPKTNLQLKSYLCEVSQDFELISVFALYSEPYSLSLEGLGNRHVPSPSSTGSKMYPTERTGGTDTLQIEDTKQEHAVYQESMP